jgi:8-oxo-dGTP pyrophosphatase MutT (NUDIX family)
MTRIEYFHDPSAPAANSLAPTAFAAVRDDVGRLLLVQRTDSGNWELPGGRVELGESAATAAEREVAEESGVTVQVTGLLGVYTDPGHVMVYPATGEVRQQFAVCFHAAPIDGRLRPDRTETCAVAWTDPDRIGQLPIHASMRERIADALNAVPTGRRNPTAPAHASHAERHGWSVLITPRDGVLRQQRWLVRSGEGEHGAGHGGGCADLVLQGTQPDAEV